MEERRAAEREEYEASRAYRLKAGFAYKMRRKDYVRPKEEQVSFPSPALRLNCSKE